MRRYDYERRRGARIRKRDLKRYERSRSARYRNERRRKQRRLEAILRISVAIAVLVLVVIGVVKLVSIINEHSAKEDQKASQEVSRMVAGVSDSKSMFYTPPTATPEPTHRPMAVALTFDDGPSRDNTDNILEVLRAYDAHATFFVVGNRVRVDADILQREIEAGCEVASHTWDHPQLSKISWKKVQKQLKMTNDIVKECGNGYKIKLLRPPYGAISQTMRDKLKMPMILWSLDTLDWKSRDAKKVFKVVKKEVKDGDIILMHDIHASTAEAVKTVVPWLQEQGYDVLTVSELMERKGKKMVNGKAYTDGNLE